MYYPSLEAVQRISQQGIGNLVPIYREVQADLETPVSAFLKIRRGGYSFLLESVEGGERPARYSFIGTEPYRVLRVSPDSDHDPLALIEEELSRYQLVANANLPSFHGGAVGYLAYDAVRHFETLPVPGQDSLDLPEAVFQCIDTVLLFDHVKHLIKVISHVRLDGDIEVSYEQAQTRIAEVVERLQSSPARSPIDGSPPPGGVEPIQSNVSRQDYMKNVQRIIEYISAGDIIQCVYSQRFSRPTFAHPFNVYRALRTINPSPYTYYLEMGDHQIIGASPELLILTEEGKVTTNPIAGTRRRGADPEEDAVLEAELVADAKERAEHLMLLDLGRNDIGRVSVPGSVKVTQQMVVERFSHVMHLVSSVSGGMRPDKGCFDAMRATFPAGTVSGAPKIRAMEIIAELEKERRGPYAGAIGYFGFGGNVEAAITIRTIVMRDGIASVQAGGGIVYDSNPEKEFDETVNKAMALFTALDVAESRASESSGNAPGY